MPRYMSVGKHQEHSHETTQWPKQAQALWIDIPQGEESDLAGVVRRLYTAHPLAVERVLHGGRRSSGFLIEEDAVVMVISDPVQDTFPDHTKPIGIFLGQNFLVTTHFDGDNGIVEEAWQHILHDESLDEGIDFALYRLLYGHLHHFYTATHHISDQFEKLHARLLKEPYRNLALDIVALRKKTYWLYNVVRPELKIYALLKEHIRYVAARNRPYFEDLYSQAQEVLSDIESYRDGLEGLVEAYSGMQSNEINKVMKFLTIISVLALPATTVASIYGMNFYIPELHWHYGYWYSLTVMFLITAVLLVYMKKNHWFR
ncbi:MAG: magnesium transporter CorA [Sulfobacillus thermosulfidooxidans]|uniref:Magnesium transporter CorA n=1 Tax=Sulfobacillus thermotolerans TaxID=338644 RepID=A0ABN5H4B4_9FIRM|nr:magnesium transporter CorA [Sulfobacillus thermotolerans]MCY0908338.1 magnesium transporter CorA family protein [Sulfobacillus thermotolerans]PSR35719.1 MAG: magnesium transporter CorA [Sulfobacillus thermosulfidooxidans]